MEKKTEGAAMARHEIEQYVSVRLTARALSVSEDTVRAAVRDGRIPSIRLSRPGTRGHIRIPLSWLNKTAINAVLR